LKKAVETQPRSDVAIADAWDRMEPGQRARQHAQVVALCEQAVKRRDCLKRLGSIDAALPADEQDRQWQARWDKDLLNNCHDARQYRKRWEKACARQEAWQKLHQCLQNRDLHSIHALSEEPLLRGYPPMARHGPAIEELRGQAQSLKRLEDLLKRRLDGLTPADLDFLRNFPPILEAEKPRVVQALRDWLSDNPVQEANTPTPPGYVRWLWPQFGLIEYCKVAISDQKLQRPEDRDDPIKVRQTDHDRHMRDNGFPVAWRLAGKRSAWVTVWAVVDLGWVQVEGPPLHLNPFRAGRAGR
jgi:hypothetical protein